jgi:PleD family two-component response regulator
MSDLSFFDPPIEIAAESPRLELITSRLKASGLRPYPASHPIDFSAADPLLIDIATATRSTLEALSRAAMVQVHRQVVLLDTSGGPLPPSGETVILSRDEDMGALKPRLMALARRASRLREAEIRRDTASAMGVRIPAADLHAVPSLLYIGEGSPLFLSLQGPLKRQGIDLTAAISRDTARRYMAERRFAAALVDLESFGSANSTTAKWIIEDGGLGALPVIALTHPDLQMTDLQNTIMALATEVVDATGRTAEIVPRVETVCRRLVAFAPAMPQPATASALTDETTRLFNPRFIERHIARQMDVSMLRAEPLCVLTFRLDAFMAGMVSAQQEFADVIRSQIRDADCPAHLAPGTFVITLPATPFRGGVRLADRISDFSAIHAKISGTGFGWRVVERRACHTPQSLLSAGLTGPLLRPRLAA